MVQSWWRHLGLGWILPSFFASATANRWHFPTRSDRCEPTIATRNLQHVLHLARHCLWRKKHDFLRVIFYKLIRIETHVKRCNSCNRDAGQKIITILEDMDTLLNTSENFLLGRWIADAKSWAKSESVSINIVKRGQLCFNWFEQELLQYEWNAKNQITLWGPKAEILDYATKQWAGVVADYFKPRWELFIAELKSSLDSGASFNQSAFAIDVFTSVEKPFTLSTKLYSSVPEGEFIYMSIGIMVMNFRLNWHRGCHYDGSLALRQMAAYLHEVSSQPFKKSNQTVAKAGTSETKGKESEAMLPL